MTGYRRIISYQEELIMNLKIYFLMLFLTLARRPCDGRKRED